MGFTIDEDNSTFVLDPAIRNWVIIPIFVVMILVTFAKHWLAIALSSKKRPDIETIQEGQIILRSQRLCNGSSLLPYFSFNARRTELTQKTLNLTKPKDAQQGNPLMNGNMMDMMPQQMVGYLPQVIIMQWVTYFFAGFIVVQLPFFLTPRFKYMLQSGMEFAGLDFCYVSSISWYFLCFIGLRGLTSVFLEWSAASPTANPADSLAMMPTQLNIKNGMPSDITKNFKSEIDNLNFVDHVWDLENVEARIMGDKYKPKTVVSAVNKPVPSGAASAAAALASQKKIVKKKKLN